MSSIGVQLWSFWGSKLLEYKTLGLVSRHSNRGSEKGTEEQAEVT